MSRLLIGPLCALFLIGQSPRAEKPPVPFEDWGVCPGEYCAYRDWIANDLIAIRSARRQNASIVFRVKPDEKVLALTGVVVTMSPGRVQFHRPEDLSSAGSEIHIEPGQTLYLLTYQGEGYTKAWFNGRLYESVDTAKFLNGVCDDDPSRCTGKIVEQTKREWWVQVQNGRGMKGWTNEPEKFDGKSAFEAR